MPTWPVCRYEPISFPLWIFSSYCPESIVQRREDQSAKSETHELNKQQWVPWVPPWDFSLRLHSWSVVGNLHGAWNKYLRTDLMAEHLFMCVLVLWQMFLFQNRLLLGWIFDGGSNRLQCDFLSIWFSLFCMVKMYSCSKCIEPNILERPVHCTM